MARIRSPKQDRGLETKEKILQAAGRVFLAKGYDRITIRDIAQEAQVGLGTLYSYYTDKKPLVLEVYRRYTAAMTGKIFSPAPQSEEPRDELPDLEDLVRTLVTRMLAVHEEYREFHTAAMTMLAFEPEVQALENDLQSQAQGTIAYLVGRYKPSWTEETCRRAARLLYWTTEGVIHRLLEQPPEERPVVLDSLVGMITSWLKTDLQEGNLPPGVTR